MMPPVFLARAWKSKRYSKVVRVRGTLQGPLLIDNLPSLTASTSDPIATKVWSRIVCRASWASVTLWETQSESQKASGDISRRRSCERLPVNNFMHLSAAANKLSYRFLRLLSASTVMSRSRL